MQVGIRFIVDTSGILTLTEPRHQVGNVAQSVGTCLVRTKLWIWPPALHQAGMVVQTIILSLWRWRLEGQVKVIIICMATPRPVCAPVEDSRDKVLLHCD